MRLKITYCSSETSVVPGAKRGCRRHMWLWKNYRKHTGWKTGDEDFTYKNIEKLYRTTSESSACWRFTNLFSQVPIGVLWFVVVIQTERVAIMNKVSLLIIRMFCLIFFVICIDREFVSLVACCIRKHFGNSLENFAWQRARLFEYIYCMMIRGIRCLTLSSFLSLIISPATFDIPLMVCDIVCGFGIKCRCPRNVCGILCWSS